ncbi:MAG: phosphoenolpyruvate--protein phosphotransferase [Lentisphaeria bacterium]|jgi:phosphotransferase system enzyme I (PtsP)
MATTDLHVIREISEIIARAGDSRDGLHQVLNRMLEHVRADAAAIFVPDDGNRRLVLFAASGKLIAGLSSSYSLPVEAGISGWVFQGREKVVADRLYRHQAYDTRDESWAEVSGAFMCLPLLAIGGCAGILTFLSEGRPRFTEQQVRFAEAMLAPVAIYVQGARLSLEQKLRSGAPPPQIMHGPLVLKGKAITPGVVRGKALLLQDRELFEAIQVEYSTDKAAEASLLQEALDLARDDTLALQKEAAVMLSEADVSIFYAHLLLLDDPLLRQRLQDALDKGFSLRFALRMVAEAFAADLLSLDNEMMRERLADIKDVILRIWHAAVAIREQGGSPGIRRQLRSGRAARGDKQIAVARELLPSQLIRLPLANLAGILCEEGGATSHVSILAKALHIPYIVGVPQVVDRVRMDDEVILDCCTGNAYLRPSAEILKQFEPALKHHGRRKGGKPAPAAPAMTTDGTAIRLMGNISLISELPILKQYGAQGIGLYRTEFMFMVRASYPSEEEQYQVFRRVVEAAGESSVTIRALDVGGDKALPYVDFGHETNTFLGWRGLRFLLSNPSYFVPHLRAILRTTAHGRVNLLLPMVADMAELQEAMKIVDRVRGELADDGQVVAPFKLGIMLEVPSAAWALKSMLPYIDFVSIGTNDLIQYTFAVDRGNSRVARWFRQMHPVVLEMVKFTCGLAAANGEKSVSVCGEMAGSPPAVPLLLGAGIRTLSMNPWLIPTIREIVGRVSLADCQELLRQSLECTSPDEVEKLAAEFARTHKLRG